MKSKSFNLNTNHIDSKKSSKSYDFVGLYKTAAETPNVKLLSVEKPKTVENLDKDNNFDSPNHRGWKKRENSPNKRKKKWRSKSVDVSQINIDGETAKTSARDSRATSTPLAGRKSHGETLKVKSIMKTSTVHADDTMENSAADAPAAVAKSKKRNKSVSFMLDDTDEVASKKTKPDDSNNEKKHKKNKNNSISYKIKLKSLKKLKKHSQAEKENKANINMETEQIEFQENDTKDKAKSSISDAAGESSDTQSASIEKKKKIKKLKKRKKVEESSPTENDSNNNEETEQKTKKPKKKKRIKQQPTETSEGEPASKVKKEVKEVAEDLENLSIGDNAHTLSSLLDGMTVADKEKKKKNKVKRKKDKPKSENKTGSVSSSETADLEKIEEGKEKVKWKKRKWNKDKKGDIDENVLSNTIIIENLPIKIMCTYKKVLADHFGKLGLIKRVGVAEVYPTDDPKPVFTTSIVFYSEGAATQALEEDNTLLEGSRIRIKRPLPASETTLVVRSYADLTEQGLSSVFTSAGRIRSIRHLVKGRKAMATAFIEFDGPEAVERALKMAEDAKIGGKKIHVSKFEIRGARRKVPRTTNGESENEGDSEDSND